ncbi:TIGR01459 family HAD-type hydrolase [Oryzifoliimicrobium ureilyticus]|uniref:TIGR01459 family HAD-type hydrolase n=1 Tax=Oryzifoliimicrobium ureilyticus TaxID=3113724 RepID=UPI003075FC2F
MPQRIAGFAEIAKHYDAVFCDVWGVLHNGVEPFAAAGHALQAARQEGVTVVLITNSPRIAPQVVAQLQQIGVPDEAYDAIVTSGDVTRALIAEGPRKVFLLGPDRDLALIEGLGVERVGEKDAEVVVCTGFFDDETETPEDYTDMLKAFASRSVPMICANPDLIVERGHRMIPCAGAMAAYYAQLGGSIRIAGKPHNPIYEAVFAEAQRLRGGLEKNRVVAIGDGMPTDVRGALDFGLDLLYISGGIHAKEYTVHGETDEALLVDYLHREQVAPRWWMPRLA